MAPTLNITSISGELRPEDEFVHPLPDGAGPAFRESYYFGFYDPVAGIGGFESFGYRALKRHSGSMLTVWRPGDVSAALELGGALDDHERYRVGGFEASCRDPFRRWEIAHSGTIHRRRDAPLRQVVEELPELDEAEEVEVELACVFESDGWIGEYERRPTYEHIFSACYEQVGRLTGRLRVGTEQYELDCPAVRHHAWGTRDWFHDDEWNWCTVVLDDGSAAGFWYRRKGSGDEVNGWLYLDGEVRSMVSVERSIRRDPAEPKALPREARFRMRDTEGRSLEVTGTVLQITPAFFRPPDDRPLLHWNDRSLAQFSSPRSGGWGEIEFIETLIRSG